MLELQTFHLGSFGFFINIDVHQFKTNMAGHSLLEDHS